MVYPGKCVPWRPTAFRICMSIVKQLILCVVLLAIAGAGYEAWQIFGPKVVATTAGGAGGAAPAANANQANNAANGNAVAGGQRGPAAAGGNAAQAGGTTR